MDQYQEGGLRATSDLGISILQGIGAGGGTTINWTTCFRTPDRILDLWQKRFGLYQLTKEELNPYFEEAEKRLKTALVVSDLVKSSSVSVSQEEVKEKIETFARSYKDPSEVIKWYSENPQQIQALESTILEQKLVDYAIANCVIEDVETTFDDLSNPMQTNDS